LQFDSGDTYHVGQSGILKNKMYLDSWVFWFWVGERGTGSIVAKMKLRI